MNSAPVTVYANLNYFLCLKTTCRLAIPAWTALFCRAIQVAAQNVQATTSLLLTPLTQ
jgi:hypothetical protein